MYRDPACYTYSLNHAVLVVGYLIAGTDRDAPGLAPPFWIIRNSWGTDWGDGGYMQMGIEGGDGICGINVLPPLYRVVKSKHACVLNIYCDIDVLVKTTPSACVPCFFLSRNL